MNEVFRFMVVRPPEAVDPAEPRLVKLADPSSNLQAALVEAPAGSIQEICADLVGGSLTYGTFVGSLSNLTTPIERLGVSLGPAPSLDVASLKSKIKEVFGVDAADLVDSKEFAVDRRNIADSIVALTITHQEVLPIFDKLVGAMRLCRLVERAAEDDSTLQAAGAIAAALTQFVLLPDNIFPIVAPAPSAPIEPAVQPTSVPSAEEIARQRLGDIRSALENLEYIKASDFRPIAPPPIKPETAEALAPQALPEPAIRDENTIASTAWLLSNEAIDRLLPNTRQIAADLGVALDATPLPEVTKVLERNLVKLGAEVYKPEPPIPMVKIGSSWVPATALETRTSSTTKPVNAGAAREIGVADLDMVKQELQRYEAGEIAHIENVLRGEKRERSHRRTTRIEESIFTETETTEETERDLQSTDRFELNRETQKTQKDETTFDAGVTVKYGGVVDIEASAKFHMTNASEESARTASKYGRDVTERSLNRIRERVLERRTRTTIEEIEEKNLHGVDNTNSDGHVVGIYRWVDKIYKAQVFNYGLRTMYEFIIPEPAAFHLYAQRCKAGEPETLYKPAEPINEKKKPLEPTDIKVDNYHAWVAQYQVGDVKPPPVPEITLAETYVTKQAPAQSENHEGEGRKIPISEGYKATQARVLMLKSPTHWEEVEGEWQLELEWDRTFAQIVVGQKQAISGHRNLWNERPLDLNDEVGQLPILIQATHKTGLSVSIEVRCKRTDERFMQWQFETYLAIMVAYQNLLSKYEEKLAALAVEEGIAISGGNPALNRELEQVELKKGAITLLTQKWLRHLDDVGAICAKKTDANGNELGPEIDFGKASDQGSLIQFLEQAFEWTQMAYTFYPYFWARKDLWPVLQQLDDNDPLHARFLRAGAARALVPARPGYEESIRHFWATGEPWNGKGPPSVIVESFRAIAEEIKEQQGQYSTKGKGTISVVQGSAEVTGSGTDFSNKDFGREIFIEGFRYEIASVSSPSQITLTKAYTGVTDGKLPYALGTKAVGDPWIVKVPTSLVILQQSPELPDFTKAVKEEYHSDVPLPRLVIGKRGKVRMTNQLPERVRILPGLDATIIARWKAGVEFKVVGGPVYKDDYLWWLVDNAQDRGWCAEGVVGNYYLEPLEQSPESSAPAVG